MKNEENEIVSMQELFLDQFTIEQQQRLSDELVAAAVKAGEQYASQFKHPEPERSYDELHYFNAPDDDKSSAFCRCGKYMADPIHIRG